MQLTNLVSFTSTSNSRRWILANGRYAIRERVTTERDRRPVFYAERSITANGGQLRFVVLSRHRTRTAAINAILATATKKKPR